MPGISPFKLEFYRGLPPDGLRGQFWGFDDAMNCYLLRWDVTRGVWGGIGFDPRDRSKAFLFATKSGDTFIVSWAPAPLTKDDILASARKGSAALIAAVPQGHA